MNTVALFVTEFADSAVVVPLSIAVALLLLVVRRPGLAWRWAVVTLCVWASIVLLKTAGYALLGVQIGDWSAVSPSGHVAASATCFAGLLALCGARRRWVLLAGVATALLIAVTRVVLGEHTVLETIIGAVIGLCGAYSMARTVNGRPLAPPARPCLVATAALIMLLTHGTRVSWEPEIRSASAHVRAALSVNTSSRPSL